MDRRLFQAAVSGNAAAVMELAHDDPAMLLGRTPQGNTCLHIASIHGRDREEFCKNILTQLDQSQLADLLSAVNKDGETPLLATVTRGHATLASVLLRFCRDQQLGETILKLDRHGCNALHHAIRSGRSGDLALELLEAEPALSKAVNERGESPMFIAAMRNFTDVFHKLLEIPDAADSGALGFNVLHGAVTSDNSAIAKRIMETRPGLVGQKNKSRQTPLELAANENKVGVLAVLLEHDPKLGYLISEENVPLLCIAASKGHVRFAEELLKHCPDAPYRDEKNGSTCLHKAVSSGHVEFIEFVLRSPQLHHLINMEDNSGETALHLAEKKDKDKETLELIEKLKKHEGIDVTVLKSAGKHGNTLILGMDPNVLEAATTGKAAAVMQLARDDPAMLLGTTPQGNTCLHIASIHGHEGFCRDAVALAPSLLEAVNTDGETPLLVAVQSGRISVRDASWLNFYKFLQKLSLFVGFRPSPPASLVPVAYVLLRHCTREVILKQDKRGCNALHHAIQSGHVKFALELIEKEPALSYAVNQYGESPMFMAVMRNYEVVFNRLLVISDSAHGGAWGYNALHAAVRNGNSDIAKRIMERRPWLAREVDKKRRTPIDLAVLWNKVEVLTVLLEQDLSLGYSTDREIRALLFLAAEKGHVAVARELLKHCPDAPCRQKNGYTCLHHAVRKEQTEFVKFVLGSPRLHRLINMRDEDDETPLHLAVQRWNPKMVAAFRAVSTIFRALGQERN